MGCSNPPRRLVVIGCIAAEEKQTIQPNKTEVAAN
jgi:hypothetical protein